MTFAMILPLTKISSHDELLLGALNTLHLLPVILACPESDSRQAGMTGGEALSCFSAKGDRKIRFKVNYFLLPLIKACDKEELFVSPYKIVFVFLFFIFAFGERSSFSGISPLSLWNQTAEKEKDYCEWLVYGDPKFVIQTAVPTLFIDS